MFLEDCRNRFVMNERTLAISWRVDFTQWPSIPVHSSLNQSSRKKPWRFLAISPNYPFIKRVSWSLRSIRSIGHCIDSYSKARLAMLRVGDMTLRRHLIVARRRLMLPSAEYVARYKGSSGGQTSIELDICVPPLSASWRLRWICFGDVCGSRDAQPLHRARPRPLLLHTVFPTATLAELLSMHFAALAFSPHCAADPSKIRTALLSSGSAHPSS